MTTLTRTAPAAPRAEAALDARWQEARDHFLAAVAPEQRPFVARLLRERHEGGHGLRTWFRNLVWNGACLPAAVPPAVVEVYLADPEALPLHDCADCGMAVPVRPDRQAGPEGEPERVYFPTCPCCGGQTGLYAYWSNRRTGG